jgi:hypothetical protein
MVRSAGNRHEQQFFLLFLSGSYLELLNHSEDIAARKNAGRLVRRVDGV